jgi:AcrR family transcriptional regulator
VPGPDDAIRLARARFMAGEKLDMGSLSDELGINRVTLYRWVGSKELLLGTVITQLTSETLARFRNETPGEGAEHVVAVVERMLEAIHSFEPMRRFLERDAEYALRILTSKESTVQRTNAAEVRDLLADEVAKGALTLPPDIDLDDLGYVIIRIGESFLYSDLITGNALEVGKAAQILRLMLR